MPACHNAGTRSARGVRSAGQGSQTRPAKEWVMVQELVRPAKLPRGAAPDTAWAYLDGKFVPIREAKISVMTHGFNYGTGVFEGIRAYWNAEQEQLYGLHLRQHFTRLHRSSKIMRISLPHTVDELVAISVELLRRCGYREDAY